MKKSIVAICCMAFMFLFSSAVFATTTSSQADDFGVVTITVANVDGTTTSFTFNPSPKVGLSVATTDVLYAITAANSLTSTTNGQEYGAYSSSSGYAQRDKTTAVGTGPVAPTDEDTLAGSGWNWLGGS